MAARDAGTVLAVRAAVFTFAENESTRAAGGPSARTSRRATVVTAMVVAAWLLSVAIGFAILVRYDQRSGQPADPPMRWPARSALERTSGRATLVMLVHPRCPCSRASLEELDGIIASAPGRATVHVVFVTPRALTDDWDESDLWRTAARMPGVHLQDDDGTEAARFGSSTSGQVVLYDADGALRFSGGITPSRGHAGDNAGRAVVIALLLGRPADETARTPVFGCSLHDPAVGDAS